MIHEVLRQGPILVAALLVVGGLSYLFVKSASAALWTLVVVFAATKAIVPPLELDVAVGGFTLFALDLVTGLMFVIGAVRLLTRPSPRAVSLPLIALSAAFMAHVAWGASAFGLQIAVNNSRLWLGVLGPLVYCAQAFCPWSRASFLPAACCSRRSAYSRSSASPTS